MTTNNQPRRYTGISGGCAGREAGRKQKTQSSKTAFHHKNGIYRKQKAAQQTTLRKFQERKFFFLTIYLYLCNRQSGSLKWQIRWSIEARWFPYRYLLSLVSNLIYWLFGVLWKSLCLAMWKVRFFFMPQRSAISFKYELIRWLLNIGKTFPPFYWCRSTFL